MGAVRFALLSPIVGLVAIAQSAAATEVGGDSGPTSKASVRISVSVAPRVHLTGAGQVQDVGSLCITGTKLGAVARVVRAEAGNGPEIDRQVSIGTGATCDGLAKLPNSRQGTSDDARAPDLLLIAPL